MSHLQEVRWGIIGVGDVCEVKSGPALQKASGSKLVAVMRRSGEKAKDFAQRHGVPKWYDNADDLIQDPDVNAVYIATPPDTHMHYTLQVAAAGKPVYVEKPMARTGAECQAMTAACAAANVPLFVAYYRRALPNFLKIKSLIDEGVIGDVRSVNIQLVKPLQPDLIKVSAQTDNWRVQPDIAGGGYFYDLASHQLDFLDYLFGPIIAAHGFAANQAGQYAAEDIVSGVFHFANGVLGQGLWCFSAAETSSVERCTIIGSKGQIDFSFFRDASVSLRLNGEEELFSFHNPAHIQQPLIQMVVDELLGKGKCPSTGTSASRTNEIMEKLSSRIDQTI